MEVGNEYAYIIFVLLDQINEIKLVPNKENSFLY